ncbi:SDR family oxidoreductase [Mucilaginibacter ginsenosidivorax]|uniref:SDR family oxidoreductase n=1 Tax=Mucilaginibacter ginsenosidivorax TaxID=862126 RepID=A0A5B8W591_9SPHI|nr:SDR family oxidoreductase [Mucilaginibacter ginsenosidivorax]QEC78923.1 SDR family oxidoreductase [Mucilaginibacter ginsenosidivorax]
MEKVIFITGASKGFGRVWTEAALERGDNVVATARNISALDDLVKKYGNSILTLPLDVTSRDSAFNAIQQAYSHFGRLDVVINNAGYGHFGATEEVSEEEARAQMDTNFFGTLWVTQAALPVMRKQKSGHIIQISSIGGVIALPVLGIYHASKFAVEAFSESLAAEVAELGIKITLVEPGGYETDWLGTSSKQSKPLEAYDQIKESFKKVMGSQSFDPKKTGPIMLKLIDEKNPPLRLLLGDVWPILNRVYEDRRKVWEDWQDLSISAS